MGKQDDMKLKLEKKKAEEMKRKLEEQAKMVSATEALNTSPVLDTKKPNNSQEIEYQRYILNLDEKLIDAIEEYVFEEKRSGKKMYDIKTGQDKRINRSLWARNVFVEALQKAGVNIN